MELLIKLLELERTFFEKEKGITFYFVHSNIQVFIIESVYGLSVFYAQMEF